MAKQLGFLLDQRYCIGCQGCQTACQAANYSEPGEFLRVADNFEVKDNGPYLTVGCCHCEKPACAENCPVGAITKDAETGIVSTDYKTCVGCKTCIKVCPYDSPKFNETKKVSHKCDFCKDRLAAGEEPACVEACPVKVLTFGDLAELDKVGVKEGHDFTVEATNPSMRFIVRK
ncbi:4Fe-4S dicluster domain-containing protein [Clostridium sp.]|uniref:4Fe-4S dicluster domain-containing protein n=1 Tax=Clostridium sp. TaxID=1506 RepID=UPI003F37108E